MKAPPPFDFREDVPLSSLTTFEVGGPARLLMEPGTDDELRRALGWAREEDVPVFLLGGGSNILVSDEGFDGLVVRRTGSELKAELAGDAEAFLFVGAGTEWDEAAAMAADEGWAGIESLSGIPGKAGAAVIQNIGAYGGQLSDTLDAVRVVDRATGEVLELPASECGLGYRMSRFKRDRRDRWAVAGIRLRLRRGGAGGARHPELVTRFGTEAAPSPVEIRSAVLEIRRGKSMVLDPDDPNRRSAGSFFMNPEVAAAEADRAAAALGNDLPRYPGEGGKVKLPAAWLIEKSGFPPGTRRGAVGLSTRHALSIVNRGGAKAADIISFAREIRRGVRSTCGVELHPEPDFVGFPAGSDGLD